MASGTATRLAVVVGADMVGGAAAGAGTKAIANACDGKYLSEGVLEQAVIGGLTGGVASGATRGLSNVIGGVSNQITKVAL